jgi:VanZ family protein
MTEDRILTPSTETDHSRLLNSPPSSRRLSRYGPVVIWAILIFFASTSALSGSNTEVLIRPLHWLFPHLSEATLNFIHGVIIRKGAHFTEYAVFGLLAARAFRTSSRDLLRRRWFLFSLLLVIAYSLGDEFHQSFVPSRTASIFDSMIDSLGGLAALCFVRIRRHSQVKR